MDEGRNPPLCVTPAFKIAGRFFTHHAEEPRELLRGPTRHTPCLGGTVANEPVLPARSPVAADDFRVVGADARKAAAARDSAPKGGASGVCAVVRAYGLGQDKGGGARLPDRLRPLPDERASVVTVRTGTVGSAVGVPP